MQPLTTKELEYIADSLSNEDLLSKQCLAAAAQTQNQAVHQYFTQAMQRHQKHYQQLLHTLQQHVQMAPTQPQ
ncbi:hypothetical protein [Brevibacillus sp. H7]|uniref:hypothetical protein n=1 Tax=Brevibacillus sp. H7 TaxID=3349138 RepID=UPI003828FA28